MCMRVDPASSASAVPRIISSISSFWDWNWTVPCAAGFVKGYIVQFMYKHILMR